jgi:uncharacterized membrane protein YbhN (UPF0104 family)
MRRGWFLGSFLVYGLVFLPAAMRWHLVLRLMDNAIHPLVSLRVSLVGHFFYTVFFGVVGGDATKAALYARWYERPLPQILASAPLDRLLGFAGLWLFMAGSFLVATLSGAFRRFGPITLRRPSPWTFLILLLVVVGCWLVRRASSYAYLQTVLLSFRSGAQRLIQAPTVAFNGILCGVLVQMGLAAVMALNVRAVTSGSLNWQELAWTLPIITIISALPITMAGLGAREGAALTLLGLYGVPAETAVAASLLTVAVSLSWAVIGAGLCFLEERRYRPKGEVLRPTTGSLRLS